MVRCSKRRRVWRAQEDSRRHAFEIRSVGRRRVLCRRQNQHAGCVGALTQALHHPGNLVAVDIDEDVAAHDDIEPVEVAFGRRKRIGDEVEGLEGDATPQILVHLPPAFDRMKLPHLPGGHLAKCAAAVDSDPSGLQRRFVHVCAQDLEVEIWSRALEENGERIDFFTGGAAHRPDAKVQVSLLPLGFNQMRLGELLQAPQLLRCAEKESFPNRCRAAERGNDRIVIGGVNHPRVFRPTALDQVLGAVQQPPVDSGPKSQPQSAFHRLNQLGRAGGEPLSPHRRPAAHARPALSPSPAPTGTLSGAARRG